MEFPEDEKSHETLAKLRSLPLRKDQLLLNRAIGLPDEALGPTLLAIISWFTKNLVVLETDFRSYDIIDRCHRDAAFAKFYANFLGNVGTGVGEFFIRERETRDWAWRLKMPRQKRSLGRDRGVFRDASLIIIASEDTTTRT